MNQTHQSETAERATPRHADNGAHPAATEDEEYPYVFNYGYPSSYWNVVELTKRYVAPGVIVDLGSGAGTIAPPLMEAGFDYVGVEQHPGALRLLNARGLRHYACDVTDTDALRATLDVIGETKAYCLVDVLEHLGNPGAPLQFLSAYALAHGSPYLVISVPNVGHRDVAYHLLAGNWNETETGLLDKTHLRFFTGPSLRGLLAESGWDLVARADFSLAESDQHDAASILHGDTQIGDFLRYVSDTFNPDNTVNQFIWLLKPRAAVGPGAARADADDGVTAAAETATPLLSIGVRTQGKRNDLLLEALFSIYGQECDDYEVIVCFHKDDETNDDQLEAVHYLIDTLPVQFRAKIRLITCTGEGRSVPLNAIIAAARGAYFGFLDDDDLLFPRHVAMLKKGVEEHGVGPIFQTFAAIRRVTVRETKLTKRAFGFRPRALRESQPPVTYPYTAEAIEPRWTIAYDPIVQQYNNDIPNCCFLVPRALIEQTNLRFRLDFDLAEDWEFLMRAAQFLKVVTLPEITAAINVRNNESNTVQNAELQPGWVSAHRKRLDEQAKRPLLVEGRIARLLFRRHIETEIRREQVEERLHAKERELADLRADAHEQRALLERDRDALRAWAQELERRLIEIQRDHQAISQWAQEMDARLRGGRRRFAARILRRIRG